MVCIASGDNYVSMGAFWHVGEEAKLGVIGIVKDDKPVFKFSGKPLYCIFK